MLALLLAGGCIDHDDQADHPVTWSIGVRPVAAPGSDPMWIERVDAAASSWSSLLREAGCSIDPFDGSAGTQPVELVADMSGHGTAIGWTNHESIEVLGTPDDLTHYLTYGHSVLMHEMGHALGLAHVAPDDDRDSIMHAISDSVNDPDAADVAEVAARLGC